MITFAPIPIPVLLKTNDGEKEGYLIYVESSGFGENDVWTCCHCEGGIVRHYRTDQLTIMKNATFDIKPKPSE